jgi:hypothetical protein
LGAGLIDLTEDCVEEVVGIEGDQLNLIQNENRVDGKLPSLRVNF